MSGCRLRHKVQRGFNHHKDKSPFDFMLDIAEI